MNVKALEQITYADFSKAVNTPFRVWLDAQSSFILDLAEVTPLRISSAGSAPNATCENFALNFTGPADKLLPQKIYRFESTALGFFDLFIVPVTVDGALAQYHATFNRLLKPA